MESVYEEVLASEFALRSIHNERQKKIGLRYKGRAIGKHKIDSLITNQVMAGLKARVKRLKMQENTEESKKQKHLSC